MKKTHTLASGAFLLIFSVLITGMAGCKKTSKKKLTPVCDGTAATYNSTAKAIIDGNCLGCHSGFSTYNGLSSIIANGQFKQHVLIDQDMPEGGSLSQDQVNKIQCWVEAGYPEN